MALCGNVVLLCSLEVSLCSFNFLYDLLKKNLEWHLLASALENLSKSGVEVVPVCDSGIFRMSLMKSHEHLWILHGGCLWAACSTSC